MTALPERTINSAPAAAIKVSPGLTSTILIDSDAADDSFVEGVVGTVGVVGVVTMVPPFFSACCIA
ncbi:hypothetical protein D3C77_586600 [compost metagenome]